MTTTAVDAHPPLPHPSAPDGLFAWVATVDHKHIGILYLLTALAFFLIGGIEALLVRTQLTVPNNTLLTPGFYNGAFSMHGVTMIFFVIMPTGIGLGNYLVPLMIGARDMAFPRLNALSFWLFLFSGLLFYYSLAAGAAPDDGWTSYPPLSLRPFSSHPGVDYWALSLLVAGIGSIAGALNLIVTIAVLRAPGMGFFRMPLFVWSMLVTAFLIIWGMPTLTAAAVMTLLDRNASASFFSPPFGGNAILYQHFFWWLGHPEVYIMVLPVFGLISEVIPVFSRKPIFGYNFVAISTILIGIYSLFVWAHHMFTVGLSGLELGFFSGASFLIAIPTSIKIFNWLATMWRGAVHMTVAMLFAVGFLVSFTMGGLTGVAVAIVPLDWQVHDTYYIVAHLHYVLLGGSLLGLYSGLYYWFPKMSGRLLSERLGHWHFWLSFTGIHLTFFPMHLMGLWGMPRRIYTYPAEPGLAELNIISTVGAFLQAAGALVFLINLWWGATRGPRAGDNPWGGWSLEWATPSPPPPENFAQVPRVRGRRPLLDQNAPPPTRPLSPTRADRGGTRLRPLPLWERAGEREPGGRAEDGGDQPP